jgi:hypothetical protein
VSGPSGGTDSCESKFVEAYFEGIPKARDMKALKTLILNAYLKQVKMENQTLFPFRCGKNDTKLYKKYIY